MAMIYISSTQKSKSENRFKELRDIINPIFYNRPVYAVIDGSRKFWVCTTYTYYKLTIAVQIQVYLEIIIKMCNKRICSKQRIGRLLRDLSILML